MIYRGHVQILFFFLQIRLNVKFHTFFMFNQGVPLHIQSGCAGPDAGLISKAVSGSRPIIRDSEAKRKREREKRHYVLLCPSCQADLKDETLNDIPQNEHDEILLPFRAFQPPSAVINNLPSLSGPGSPGEAVSADCGLWHRAGD